MKRLESGVLDTSALVCVLYGEPGEGAFLEGFLRCDRLLGYPISRKGVPSLARSAGGR